MEWVFLLWVGEGKSFEEDSRISHSQRLQTEKDPFPDAMDPFERGFLLPFKMEA
jgi:hypothetical protein